MDYGAIGIGIGIAGVIFAGLAWLLSDRALKYKMLAELMRDYADSKMGEAVGTLWDFQRECVDKKKQLEAEFERRLKKMKKNKGKEDKSKEDKETEMIDSHRRRVSHFYHCMAALHHGRVVPDKVLYRIWHEKTLKIIPKIIMPLGNTLIKLRGEDPDDKEYVREFELLDALHKDSTKPGMTIF